MFKIKPSQRVSLITLLFLLNNILSFLSKIDANGESVCEDEKSCTAYVDADLRDPCRDYNDNCEFWASEGECNKNPQYMKMHCLASCGVCTVFEEEENENEGPPCEDLHEMCALWAKEGECMVNPAFMESACRMSCYLCVDESNSRKMGEDEELIARKLVFQQMDLGPHQQIPGGAKEEGTRDMIKKMDKYAKEVVTKSEFDQVREKCKNADKLCASWSATGECSREPNFMLNDCPLACLACDKIALIDRCSISMGKNEGRFNEGSIDALFMSIKDGKWAKYMPEFVTMPTDSATSVDPWIVRFDSFLTNEETDHFIKLADTIGWKPSTIDEDGLLDGKKGTVPTRRVSHSAHCGTTGICESDSVFQNVMDRIAQLASVPIDNLEHVELLKYSHADSYGLHHDFKVDQKWKPAGPRVLTFLLYLSDVEKGGATGFPELDWLFIKPKKGQMLLWSNVLDSDPKEKNPKMVYETLPVVEGELFAAHIWVHNDDWMKAFTQGCA